MKRVLVVEGGKVAYAITTAILLYVRQGKERGKVMAANLKTML